VRRSVLLVLSVALAVSVFASVAAAQSDDRGADDRHTDARIADDRGMDDRGMEDRASTIGGWPWHGRRDGQPCLYRLDLVERVEQRFDLRDGERFD
jgi:hypothetical protein